MNRTALILPVLVIAVAAALSSVFIVDEREKALVLQFGQIRAVREDPGLYFKLPIIQEVVRYDDRILGLDVEPLEITPLDDRRLVVTDYFLDEDDFGKIHFEGDHKVHVINVSDDGLVEDTRFPAIDFNTAFPTGPARPHGIGFN